jgi:hypothetical protein
MYLKKSHKILLLLGTVLPILYMIGFMVTIFLSMFLTIQHKGEPWIFKDFAYLFVMHGPGNAVNAGNGGLLYRLHI